MIPLAHPSAPFMMQRRMRRISLHVEEQTTPQASAGNKYIYRGSHAFTHLLTHPLISLTHTKNLQPPAL